MLTRCPYCQTAFRVTSEQLKVRQGRVRCGACQNVFDALDSLADELPAMPLPEAEPVESTEAVEPIAPVTLIEPAQAIVPPETVEDASLLEIPQDHEPEAAPEPEPPQPEAAPAPQPEAEPAEPESPVPESGEAETEAEPWLPEETPPARRWSWIGGAILMLLLAAGQLLFIFRVELGVLAPELRPALAAGCELVGCVLPYPSKSELVGIETSDLAPAGTDRLLLTATIKNRAPFIQEYPHLELTLTDTRDEPMLRKVLPPATYLQAGQAVEQGFPARGEVGVRLQLEAQGVPAVGYRLYLFYP